MALFAVPRKGSHPGAQSRDFSLFWGRALLHQAPLRYPVSSHSRGGSQLGCWDPALGCVWGGALLGGGVVPPETSPGSEGSDGRSEADPAGPGLPLSSWFPQRFPSFTITWEWPREPCLPSCLPEILMGPSRPLSSWPVTIVG